MTVKHHPDIATLMAFSAGTLDEPYTTVIATHLAMSQAARATVRKLETIGGALLASEPKAELQKDALERLLGSLGEGPVVAVPQHKTDPIPAPLRPYLPTGLEGVRWKWTGPGVAQANLAVGKDGKSRLKLMRVAGGRSVPEHSHGGQELTLILRGAYRDRLGVFEVGDISDHDEEVEHQPIAEAGEDCICLVAVNAPLSFRSRLVRLLQPLFGL